MALERRLMSFDVPMGPISRYDVGDSLEPLRRLPGVQSVSLLEATEGSPRYLLDVQLDGAAGEQLDRALDRMLVENGDYLTNMTRRRYTLLA